MSDVQDQIFRTFRLLGTPTEIIWPGLNKLPDWKLQFPQWQPKDLLETLPELGHLGIDLISVRWLITFYDLLRLWPLMYRECWCLIPPEGLQVSVTLDLIKIISSNRRELLTAKAALRHPYLTLDSPSPTSSHPSSSISTSKHSNFLNVSSPATSVTSSPLQYKLKPASSHTLMSSPSLYVQSHNENLISCSPSPSTSVMQSSPSLMASPIL